MAPNGIYWCLFVIAESRIKGVTTEEQNGGKGARDRWKRWFGDKTTFKKEGKAGSRIDADESEEEEDEEEESEDGDCEDVKEDEDEEDAMETKEDDNNDTNSEEKAKDKESVGKVDKSILLKDLLIILNRNFR